MDERVDMLTSPSEMILYDIDILVDLYNRQSKLFWCPWNFESKYGCRLPDRYNDITTGTRFT
jgi:hypothetical protein